MTLLHDLDSFYMSLADEGKADLTRLATKAGASDPLIDLSARSAAAMCLVIQVIVGAVLISPLVLTAVVARIYKACKRAAE